jgi:FtsZ-binding cell division protein ZapB
MEECMTGISEMSEEQLRKGLLEAEAVIMLAQEELGSNHPVWWVLDGYDGSMEAVKEMKDLVDKLRAERDEAVHARSLFRQEIQKAANDQKERIEHLIAIAADASARKTIESLRERGMIVSPEMTELRLAAEKLVSTYRQEGVGWKPRTESMMQFLILAVDNL